MNDLIEVLKDKDNNLAYALVKQIIIDSTQSEKYYKYFDEFIGLLSDSSSYVRTRGFCLACAQARWDKSQKLKNASANLFKLLHDAKPTVVRQCLGALHEVVLYRPELSEQIKKEINSIDLLQYKGSMSSLIKKDIDELLKLIQ